MEELLYESQKHIISCIDYIKSIEDPLLQQHIDGIFDELQDARADHQKWLEHTDDYYYVDIWHSIDHAINQIPSTGPIVNAIKNELIKLQQMYNNPHVFKDMISAETKLKAAMIASAAIVLCEPGNAASIYSVALYSYLHNDTRFTLRLVDCNVIDPEKVEPKYQGYIIPRTEPVRDHGPWIHMGSPGVWDAIKYFVELAKEYNAPVKYAGLDDIGLLWSID